MSSDGRLILGQQLRTRKGQCGSMALGAEAQAAGRSSQQGSGTSLVSLSARACGLATLFTVGVWVHQLGGVSTRPEQDGASTDRLFNWHPVLMTLGFGLLMTEAVLAYKAPWQQSYSRPQRKQVHWVFHSLAFLSALLGFLAAWKSHTLKQPPIPNFYSPHSYIGLTALLLLVGQYVVGFASYLWPTITIEQRVALGPLHRFLGLAVYGTGMAAAAVGLQEKATFLQAFGKKAVNSSFIRLPALAELLLVATVLLVMWHYAAPSRRPQVQYSVLHAADEEGGAAAS